MAHSTREDVGSNPTLFFLESYMGSFVLFVNERRNYYERKETATAGTQTTLTLIRIERRKQNE